VAGSSSGTNVGVYSTSASGQDTFSFYTGHSDLTLSGAKSVGAGASYLGSASITAPYDGSVTVVSHDSTTYIVVVLNNLGSSSTTM